MTTRNEKCVVFSVIADLCFRILELTHVCALTRRQKLVEASGYTGRHTSERRRNVYEKRKILFFMFLHFNELSITEQNMEEEQREGGGESVSEN